MAGTRTGAGAGAGAAGAGGADGGATTGAGLAGLPGSTPEPGDGPAEPGVLDALLDDGSARRLPLAEAAAAHRALLAGDLRDLVAALVVPADRAGELPDVLTAGDLGTRVLLTADPTESAGPGADGGPVAALRSLEAARSALWDEDRIELVGRRLPLPAGAPDPATLAAGLLPLLASTVPTWLTLPPDAASTAGTASGQGDAGAVLDVLAADGAEYVTLDVSGDPLTVARLLRALVDRDLTFRTTGVPTGPKPGSPVEHADGVVPGVLNVLCAVRAALNGAEAPELAQVLAADRPELLVSAVRRMSAADGAVVRAFLVAVEVPDATAAAARLQELGLVDDTFS